MSDPNVTVTPAAPTVVVDPQAPKPAPAAAAPAAPQGEPSEKPSWLDARLERERRAVLKDLGIESVDDAKKSLAELHAKREAEKSAAQKAAELEASLKAEKAKGDEMAKAIGAFAKAKMAGLTDAQRAAVTAVAGEDATKQLATIEALAPTWAAPAASAATAPAAPAAPARPADTAPAPSAPSDGVGASPPDPKAVYAELKKTNPVIAARYAIANGVHNT